jgi:hypothetical protein
LWTKNWDALESTVESIVEYEIGGELVAQSLIGQIGNRAVEEYSETPGQ